MLCLHYYYSLKGNKLGLEASSGYGVACKLVNFAMLIPSALMQSTASFISQNVGAGNEKRAKKTLFTGIGVGLTIGCIVFIFIMFKGDILTGIFTTDEAVIQKGYDYLRGFAPETMVTAILFSMIGYLTDTIRLCGLCFRDLYRRCWSVFHLLTI